MAGADPSFTPPRQYQSVSSLQSLAVLSDLSDPPGTTRLAAETAASAPLFFGAEALTTQTLSAATRLGNLNNFDGFKEGGKKSLGSCAPESTHTKRPQVSK